MLFIQILVRLLGIFFIIMLIFYITDQGKQFIAELDLPLDNASIREIFSLDLDENADTTQPINDQRPLYTVFDLPSFIFVVFLIVGYSFLSFDVYEFIFLSKHLLISTSVMQRKLNNLNSKMKDISENYYTNGTDSLGSVVDKKTIPKVWDIMLEQIEMRIPFEDILRILGNSAALTRKKYDLNIKLVANLSNLAPSFGVMGTVLGLVQVLRNLSDPSDLGPSMSLALLTTFYGLFCSVLLFKPILTHLENMKTIEMNSYQSASFWLKIIADNKPSFYLEQATKKKI